MTMWVRKLGTLFIGILIGFSLVNFSGGVIADESKEVNTEYEKRKGVIEHEQYGTIKREICIQTIDNGKNWLLVTPHREVIGYLHKKLPNVDPDDLETVQRFKDKNSNKNYNFYYDWL